jgi:hypothetical protein
MKVFYNTILNSEGSVHEYKFIRVEVCCEPMKEALHSEFIKFGEMDDLLNQSNTVNIFRSHHYPEGCYDDAIPIYLCPFCGEKISCEEEKRFKLKKVEKRIPEQVKTDYELIEVPKGDD